jgi:hypothetical protein
MRWVFSKFNERLLTLNHLFKYLNMVVMSLIKSLELELVTIATSLMYLIPKLILLMMFYDRTFVLIKILIVFSMNVCL